MIRLQNKTQLRQILKNALDTTTVLEVVQVRDDGSWTIVGVNDNIEHTPSYKIVNLVNDVNYELDRDAKLDEVITHNFREIEKSLNK